MSDGQSISAVSASDTLVVAPPLPPSSITSSSAPTKKRIRAVVACSYCRSKRSKCDGLPGRQACTECQQRGIDCEMTDGKRNRGHYKPQAEALAKRVRQLEEALAASRATNQELLVERQQLRQQVGEGAQQGGSPAREAEGETVTVSEMPGTLMDLDDIPPLPTSMPVLVSDKNSTAVTGSIIERPGTSSVVMAASAVDLTLMAPPARSLPATATPPQGQHQQQQEQQQQQQHPPHAVLEHGHIVCSGTDSPQGGGGNKSMEVGPSPRQPTEKTIKTTQTAKTTTTAAAGAPFPFPQDRLRPCCCADLDLSPPLVDYLLGLFFHRYQMMMKFVSQQAFMREYHLSSQSESGHSGHHHQTPLLLAMLAAGVRYSTRRDVTARFLVSSGINGSSNENKLATAARQAVEIEISRPTLATVQTVLILCEVETSLDHQMTGYMYACLASKLIVEMGLDRDTQGSPKAPLSADDTAIRHWLVWAASVHDQFWSVFLRRPLAIQNGTLQRLRRAWRCSAARESPALPPPRFEDEVDDDLMDLMVLAREITDALYGGGSGSISLGPPAAAPAVQAVEAPVPERSVVEAPVDAPADAPEGDTPSSPPYDGGGLPSALYEQAAQRQAARFQTIPIAPPTTTPAQLPPDVALLDARLDAWFHGLSDRVRQGPIHAGNGHSSYHYLFVLHLHYNATKIMMHRTRAFQPSSASSASSAPVTTNSYPLQSPVSPPAGGVNNESPPLTQSVTILGHAAIRMARLFETFRRREDIRILQSTGVQWAGMASEALTWYIETLPLDGAVEAVAHLQSLARTLKDMAKTFLTAIYPYDRTQHAVQTFLGRMDGGGEESPAGNVPETPQAALLTTLPPVGNPVCSPLPAFGQGVGVNGEHRQQYGRQPGSTPRGGSLPHTAMPPPPTHLYHHSIDASSDAFMAPSPATGVGMGGGSTWAWAQQESWDWDELLQQ
ncbi:hypothetical protein SBRCBS47491_008873 [Sporothrix bragantina]|uniref:Zn(2)-C6 fungal-type domain-containing protein n=1 Tax=Sporothrix bragantina TaxID=671064 RepID=A0ABP0CQ20_9PEZI